MMKDKFRQMTEREKAFVAERNMAAGESNTLGSSEIRIRSIEDIEQSENTPGGHEDGLAAMEHFASVWSTHDDDLLDDDDTTEPDEIEVPVSAAVASRSSRSSSPWAESKGEGSRDSLSGGLIERGTSLLGGVIFAKSRRSLNDDDNDRPRQSSEIRRMEATSPSDERSFEGYDYYEAEVPIAVNNVSVFEDDDSKEYHVALAPPSKPYASDDEQSGHSSNGSRSLTHIDHHPGTGQLEQDSYTSFAEDTEHNGDDLNALTKKIENDDLQALETEASVLAEQFKLNSTLMESISDLQCNTDENGRNESGLHNLDISKITAGTGTTDDDDRHLGMPDSMFGSPFRSVNRSTDITDDMYENSSSSHGAPVSASAGESSGAAVASAWRMLETINGTSMQNAGEPSGAGPTSSESFEGYYDDDDDDDYNLKHPIPHQYQSPKRQDSIPRSPAAAKKPPFPVNSPATESPMNRSSQKNVSYSIADWSAVGMTGGILADLSDSQSTSSYAESYTDSSMDASGRPSSDLGLDIPLDREIDDLVAHADFDAVKVAADNYGVSTYTTKNDSTEDDEERERLEKIAQRKQKKRDLEAWRISLSKSFEKDN
jgi:hypothetical protein